MAKIPWIKPEIGKRCARRHHSDLGTGVVVSINGNWVNVDWDDRKSEDYRFARINHMQELEGLQ